MTTLGKLRKKFLENINDPYLIDEFLCDELNLTRTNLILNINSRSFNISNNKRIKLNSDLKKIQKGEPLQYIVGFAKFYGRRFFVNKDVLIPEIETADMIDYLKNFSLVQSEKNFSLIDIGTGSGNIAITLALEFPKSEIFASDIDKKALQIAKKNERNLLNKSRIHFIQTNLFNNIHKKFNLIVSNPPYIKNKSLSIEKTVAKYEPRKALFGGKDGLNIYRKLIPQSYNHLKKNGKIMLEIDKGLKNPIKKIILDSFPKAKPIIFKDINGLDRFITWKK